MAAGRQPRIRLNRAKRERQCSAAAVLLSHSLQREAPCPPALIIAIRVGSYAAVFAALALWEWSAPRPKLVAGRTVRWPGNLGILAVDIAVVRLLVPTAAVGFALVAEQEGWGLFRALGVPFWAAVLAGVIALDLVIYLQHVVFHYVPVL